MLNTWEDRVCRFVMYYPLTEEEKQLFIEKFKTSNKVMQFIAYYQDNDKEAFKRKRGR